MTRDVGRAAWTDTLLTRPWWDRQPRSLAWGMSLAHELTFIEGEHCSFLRFLSKCDITNGYQNLSYFFIP